MTDLPTKYYEKGAEPMIEGMRTMAFQMPAEMFLRLKKHLEREFQRTGKKVSQKQFMLDLIQHVLDEAEQKEGADQQGLFRPNKKYLKENQGAPGEKPGAPWNFSSLGQIWVRVG